MKILQEELPRHGFNIKVIAYGEGKNSSEVYYISRQQSKLIRYLKYFWQVFKLSKWADVVYTQGPVSEGYPTHQACKLRKRKYILKIVGDYAWEQSQQRFSVKELLDDFQNKKYNEKVEQMRNVQKKVARGAEKIIVPSEYLKKIVNHWGVKSEKINVIYNAVNFSAARKLEKPLGEKWLVSVGRLVPWKGMDALIEIMLDLLSVEPNLKLIIIGDGLERWNAERRIQNSGLQKSVKLLGRLPKNETLSYIKASDVFVLNTGYEGLPHTVLEAMSCGTPVITTNVCGNPEAVEDGRTGLLVEYNNKEQIKGAILKLLQDKNLADKLTANAKASLEKFDKQKMINDTIKILKQ